MERRGRAGRPYELTRAPPHMHTRVLVHAENTGLPQLNEKIPVSAVLIVMSPLGGSTFAVDLRPSSLSGFKQNAIETQLKAKSRSVGLYWDNLTLFSLAGLEQTSHQLFPQLRARGSEARVRRDQLARPAAAADGSPQTPKNLDSI